MNELKIYHALLKPIEYYLVQFNTQEDVTQFAKEHPWFKPEQITINIPEKCVIEYYRDSDTDPTTDTNSNTTTDTSYFEKLTATYFKNTVAQKAQLYNAILQNAQQFFR